MICVYYIEYFSVYKCTTNWLFFPFTHQFCKKNVEETSFALLLIASLIYILQKEKISPCKDFLLIIDSLTKTKRLKSF